MQPEEGREEQEPQKLQQQPTQQHEQQQQQAEADEALRERVEAMAARFAAERSPMGRQQPPEEELHAPPKELHAPPKEAHVPPEEPHALAMAIVAAVEEEAKAEASLAADEEAADKEEANAQDAQVVQEAEEAEEAKVENSDSEDMGACPPAPLLQAPEVVAVLQALAQRDIVETEAAIARAHGADIDPTVLTNLTEEPLRWLREQEARRPFAAAELQRTLEAMELPALRVALVAALDTGVTGDVVEKATAALAVLEAQAAARSAAEAALQDAVAREDLDALPQAIEEAEAKGADVVLLSAARGSVRRLRQAIEDRRAADAALRSSLERQAEDPTSEAANVGVANALVQARACALDDAPLIERAAILVRLWQQEQEAKEAVARLQAAAEAEAAAAEAEEAEERRLEAVRARVREAEEAARREEEEHHALLEQQRVRREARIDEEHRRRKEAEEREEMEREQLREAVRKGAAVRKQGAAAASTASEASAGATGGGGSLLQQIRQRHAAAAADRAAATPPSHALSTSFLSSSALLSSSSSVVTVAAHGIGLGRCAPGQDPSGVMSSMPPLELDPDKTPAVLLAFASAGDADELVAAAAEAAGVGHRTCADKKEKAAVVQRL